MTSIAALLFCVATAAAAGFQIALAAGAPWGHLAMGGKFPGRFPGKLRVAAVVQGVVLVGLALVVLARAHLALPSLEPWSARLIWAVVVISGLSLVMNLATPSKWERRLWAPVGAVMLGCSLVVALSS